MFGKALGLVDRYGEVWTFNIITGLGGKSAIWAAQQLDPRTVHVNANDLTIRELDLEDTERFKAFLGITTLTLTLTVTLTLIQGLPWYCSSR